MSGLLGDSANFSNTNDTKGIHKTSGEALEKDDIPKTTKKSAFKITSVTKKSHISDANTDVDNVDGGLDNQTVESSDNPKVLELGCDAMPDDNYIGSDDSIKEKTQDVGGPSRFKVVKIETKEPFRRGRWVCHDFFDQSSNKDRVDVKILEEIPSGNSSGSSSVNLMQGFDDLTKSQQNINSHIPGSVALLHSLDNSTIGHQTSNTIGTVTTNGTYIENKQKQMPSQLNTSSTVMADHIVNVHSPLDNDHTRSLYTGVNQVSQSSAMPVVYGNVAQSSSHFNPLVSSQLSSQSPTVSNPQIQRNIDIVPNPISASSKVVSQQTQSIKPMQSTATVQPVYKQITTDHSQAVSAPHITQTSAINQPVTITDINVSGSQHRKAIPSLASIQHNNISDSSMAISTILSNGIHMHSSNITSKDISTDLGNGDSFRLSFRKTSDKSIPQASQVESQLIDSKLAIASNSILTPLADAVVGLGNSNTDKESGGSGMMSLDNRIEQAMDLVKHHLKFAVREEFDVLREQVVELVKANTQLELENSILKANATPETLAKLSSQTRPPLPPSSSS